MTTRAYLILENRMIFEGEAFGAQGDVTGEVVFTTGMAGYLETSTGPSYHGQIVLQAFPLIGSYDVSPADFEGDGIGESAYIVKHPCQDSSNFCSEDDLDTFLCRKGIVGFCGIDTRALTRIIRESGMMNGRITSKPSSGTDLESVRADRIDYALTCVSMGNPHAVFFEENASAAVLNEYCDKDADINVRLIGGELPMRYPNDAVYMTGGCKKVFDGAVEI